jgi:tetratricopeptide (TPR) repeat protein
MTIDPMAKPTTIDADILCERSGSPAHAMTESRGKPARIDDPAALEAEGLVQAGLAASQAGESEKALHLFARACVANPGSATPHFLMGSEYAALGEMEKAETALANAVVLAPALHIARYQLGLLQFSSGRASMAFVSWGPLFDLDEAQPLLHFVRGFAALAQDDFAAAQAHFEAGLLRNQHNPPLSADIQKVIDGMKQLQAAGGVAAKPNGGQATEHVLVSNYGKFGTLH